MNSWVTDKRQKNVEGWIHKNFKNLWKNFMFKLKGRWTLLPRSLETHKPLPSRLERNAKRERTLLDETTENHPGRAGQGRARQGSGPGAGVRWKRSKIRSAPPGVTWQPCLQPWPCTAKYLAQPSYIWSHFLCQFESDVQVSASFLLEIVFGMKAMLSRAVKAFSKSLYIRTTCSRFPLFDIPVNVFWRFSFFKVSGFHAKCSE